MFNRPACMFWVLLVCALSGERAFAEDEAPAIDPPGHWRVMGQDDAHSTSRCIGEPDAPLCAIESIVACYVRSNNDLCKAGLGPYWVDLHIEGPPQMAWTRRYRVVKVKQIARDNQRHSYIGRHPPPVLKGDLIVTLQSIDCYDGKCEKALSYPLGYTAFLMRQDDNQWHVVTWSWVVDRW